jgi:hypothetical protein
MPEPLDTLRPGLPPPLVSLVRRCLAKSPAERPDTAGAVITLLDESLDQLDARRPPRTRRIVITGLAAAGVLTVSTGTWLALRPERTLLASGTLVERQPLVVADFQAAGADSGIGATLGTMFGRYLGESRRIAVMPRNQVDSVLRLMRPYVHTPINSSLSNNLYA